MEFMEPAQPSTDPAFTGEEAFGAQPEAQPEFSTEPVVQSDDPQVEAEDLNNWGAEQPATTEEPG